jgi:3-oxoadipate enol-lactonase
MSLVQTAYGNIYVEHHEAGHHETLLVLNGIMMSSLSWTMFLPTLIEKVNVVLIDLLDQGKSDKATQAYTVHDQSLLVYEVLQSLNIHQINVCGISYGGEVAMDLAISYPGLIQRLILFNTTAKTSLWLKDIGDSWIEAAKDPLAFYTTTIPTIYSHRFYESHQAWMKQRKETLLGVFSDEAFIQSMIRLTHSSEAFDVSENLSNITAPTLVLSSEFDTITPIYEQERIAQRIPNAQHLILKGCGHASMYELPNVFVSLVLGHISHQHQLKL